MLSVLRPRPSSEDFWERFADTLAHLHLSTIHRRFGWHRDNWLGRRRQINTWGDDGFAFFAEHRLLRWLGQPRVDAALDAGWPARMPIIQLRRHLAVLAQFDDDWGAAGQIRATLAPFRTLR